MLVVDLGKSNYATELFSTDDSNTVNIRSNELIKLEPIKEKKLKH